MARNTLKVALIVGTRPQLIKAGQLARAFGRENDGFGLILVDTNQHYDASMASNDVTGLASRVRLLNGDESPRFLESLLRALRAYEPLGSVDCVATIGDTNSTLAATLVAADLGKPIVHIEAGLRSFDRSMPEERNRLAADHISDLLLAPSRLAMEQLDREGLGSRSEFTGDISYDLLLHHLSERSLPASDSQNAGPVLFTVHRPSNTDDAERREGVFRLASQIAQHHPLLFPAHPRIAAEARDFFSTDPRVDVVEPLTHRELLSTLMRAPLVVTDSGGIQREAFWLATRCATLRPETEWVETLEDGRNTLLEPTDVDCAVDLLHHPLDRSLPVPSVYGEGDASRRVYLAIQRLLMD